MDNVSVTLKEYLDCQEGKFKITLEKYQEFQAFYTWTVVENPSYRYGQAFINYFDGASEYFESISNLGTPPGVIVPSLESVIWLEKSISKVQALIEDLVVIC